MTNKNKAFTLVELSIVLVIIGVLMGMVMKGKSLIDTAKFKADLSRIRNIAFGLNSYLYETDFNEVSYLGNGFAHLNYPLLLDRQYISQRDLLPATFDYPPLNYSNPSEKNYMNKIPVTIVSCYIESSGGKSLMQGDSRDRDKGRSRSVCIALRNTLDKSGGENISPYQACRFDLALDDADVFSGIGLMSIITPASFSVPNGNECEKNSKERVSSQGWVYMLYE